MGIRVKPVIRVPRVFKTKNPGTRSQFSIFTRYPRARSMFIPLEGSDGQTLLSWGIIKLKKLLYSATTRFRVVPIESSKVQPNRFRLQDSLTSTRSFSSSESQRLSNRRRKHFLLLTSHIETRNYREHFLNTFELIL